MVEYQKTMEMRKKECRQAFWRQYRLIFWIWCVFLPVLGVWQIVRALAFDGDALVEGIVVCGIGLLFGGMLIAFYTRYHQALVKQFAETGDELLRLDFIDGEYLFANVTKGTVTHLPAADIKKVIAYKSVLIVQHRVTKQVIIFTNTEEIRALFAPFLGRKAAKA